MGASWSGSTAHNRDLPASGKGELAPALDRLEQVETSDGVDKPDNDLVAHVIQAE